MESFGVKQNAVFLPSRVSPSSRDTNRNDEKIYYYNDSKLKRAVDVFLSLLTLILVSPLFLVISLAVKLNSKGPVLFAQTRIGKNGVHFQIFKFRTMHQNAEGILRSNEILYQKYKKNNFKLPEGEDPRLTSLGKFLRKTSLDELPQIFNVIKGDMSLVGPRPIVNEEAKLYGKELQKFLSVKPGVTGYWQISGRSLIEYPERKEYEIRYVDRQSLLFDIKILIKTIFVILRRKGAF